MVPQQDATADCAIYTVLFAHALHNDIPVASTSFRINGRVGRTYVAHCLLTGEAPQLSHAAREHSMGGPSFSTTHSEEIAIHINLLAGENMNSTTCSKGDTDHNTNSREAETNQDTTPNHRVEDLRDSMSHPAGDTSPLDEALVHYAETRPCEDGSSTSMGTGR